MQVDTIPPGCLRPTAIWSICRHWTMTWDRRTRRARSNAREKKKRSVPCAKRCQIWKCKVTQVRARLDRRSTILKSNWKRLSSNPSKTKDIKWSLKRGLIRTKRRYRQKQNRSRNWRAKCKWWKYRRNKAVEHPRSNFKPKIRYNSNRLSSLHWATRLG